MRAGSIVGSGTVSNKDWSRGYSCIAEKRAIETIEAARPGPEFMRWGDSIRIEMKGADGQSLARSSRRWCRFRQRRGCPATSPSPSIGLPQGSRKNIVHCSPGWLATQLRLSTNSTPARAQALRQRFPVGALQHREVECGIEVLADVAGVGGLERLALMQRELVVKKSKSTQVAVLRAFAAASTPP